MKEELITEISRKMLPYLDNAQLSQLQEVLTYCFWNVEITQADNKEKTEDINNIKLLQMFIASKRLEGCSDKTLKYYQTTLMRMFDSINVHVTHIKTDDLRKYLSDYQKYVNAVKVILIIFAVFYLVFLHGLKMKIILLKALLEGFIK